MSKRSVLEDGLPINQEHDLASMARGPIQLPELIFEEKDYDTAVEYLDRALARGRAAS